MFPNIFNIANFMQYLNVEMKTKTAGLFNFNISVRIYNLFGEYLNKKSIQLYLK